MTRKIEVSINVIIHATEDISKILHVFNDILGLPKESFTIHEMMGHFANPIIMLNTIIVKKEAAMFMKRFLNLLSSDQINMLVSEIAERTMDSRFHIRLDKQKLVNNIIMFGEKDSIKLKIHTPIYNKNDMSIAFREIFQIDN